MLCSLPFPAGPPRFLRLRVARLPVLATLRGVTSWLASELAFCCTSAWARLRRLFARRAPLAFLPLDSVLVRCPCLGVAPLLSFLHVSSLANLLRLFWLVRASECFVWVVSKMFELSCPCERVARSRVVWPSCACLVLLLFHPCTGSSVPSSIRLV